MNAGEEVERLRRQALEAAEDGDYDTALNKVDAIRIVIDTSPNTEQESLRLEWRDMQPLVARLEKLRARQLGHGKVRRIPIRRQYTHYDNC